MGRREERKQNGTKEPKQKSKKKSKFCSQKSRKPMKEIRPESSVFVNEERKSERKRKRRRRKRKKSCES